MNKPYRSHALLALLAFAAGTALAAGPSATDTLPGGIVVKHLTVGKGKKPSATDTVEVHYRGTLADGKEFDSSHKRGQTARFPLNRVIPCWTQGLQRMSVGGKAVLTCPPSMAYGERGAGGVVPPNATLTFEVELVSIQ
ncbi:FKBP-type peptidyl-prolyl cis-trans isomerase [Ramlibacter sp. AW1]|uniref:Peptidyl-prolyl cis-trans isomerase n=1 Tax=Ramlibacter aurantiacus TaxID=2801330 RepID=A0A936ZXR7_9BURK|nr:FKBP-type peptidyl-prolyl cis-trans isomerase [Ramlibacter aurantiacus]MBL0423030.1 FKBP-type peptidyl-prolyl cis-trans isomerase [Ramlibacter aurantiacus]